MSFRTRLTSFFALIVVVPMVAVGVLVFRLISDSERGKADARANGLATAAASLYNSDRVSATSDARTIARNPSLLKGRGFRARLSSFAAQAGLARVRVTTGSSMIADIGDRTAIAPGTATVTGIGSSPMTVTAFVVNASDYAHSLGAPPSADIVVRQDGRVLGATRTVPAGRRFPRQGTVSLGGTQYRVVTLMFTSTGDAPVAVTVLSNLSATANSVNESRVIAAIVIGAFLILAFLFSVLASRALHGQIGRFLDAARRLGGGDFSSPVPIEGNDEFAALGQEFNNMSTQLAHRLEELSEERVRLRESIRRIGETFAANLDRPALLELALKTAVDAVHASRGRLTARSTPEEPLAEVVRVGSLAGLEDAVHDAERAALGDGTTGEATSSDVHIASVALGAIESTGRAHGLITVAREGRPFTENDRDLLRSLAAQATLALENVELHVQVSRQAVTDELTGLANHGRFQELLSAEIEEVRRYHHTVGLIMLDIDDFKAINDTYGHQQGDVVLKHVARVLQASSREPDTPARYGGEEMAVILPHTDLEGAYTIAERIRSSIRSLRIPRLDHGGVLRVTASLGVAASAEGEKNALISEADAALYAAKRHGKNRTVKGEPQTANVFRAE
jgi:diguanylate cyclase (GGDEF)-like protein